MIGQTISHFKVIEKIGQGGMGVVYRAQDTNLSRDVAIKVLPEQFTQDPQRLARFEREAKLLASLNHPNIAAIHSFEHADDVHFLVLELVEGETLADLLTKGPVPVEKTLELCQQIAEGVEAAHEKGVIHRDLKPANVKVTPEGKVKILDFGLAKAFEGEVPVADISQSPTLTEEMTRAGVILGTAAYMSPEQARGKPVDKRADIFAFGSVLFELLTGKRAFEGETVTDTIASILKGEPEWDLLPPSIPSTIRFLMSRCLQKDPGRRLQHIDGARILIEEALSGAATVSSIGLGGAMQPALWKRTIPWIVAVVGVVVAVIALWNSTSPIPTPEPVVRFVAALPADLQMGQASRGIVALSRDGAHLAYAATRGGTAQLYLRSMEQLEARPIPGTEDVTYPFFSPNGQWLGFFAGGKLKKVSLSGGTPVILCDVYSPFMTASWDSEDTILCAPPSSVISQVSAAGGTPEVVTTLDSDQGESSHSSPQLLPDGDTLLFTANSPEGRKVVVQSLETGERKIVLEGTADARYVPTGHLVYAQAGALMAVAFDLGQLEAIGTATPILEGVMQVRGANSPAHLAFSDTGTLVYVPSRVDPSAATTLVWVDRQGKMEPLAAPPSIYINPRLSPDGQRVAFDTGGAVWLYDIGRDNTTRFTFQGGIFPLWTPDGERITDLPPRTSPPSKLDSEPFEVHSTG